MKSNKAQRRSLRLEPLESRLAMDSTASAAAGLPWFDLGALTYSFVPDGTRMGRHASTLFDELASTGTTEQWQEEFRLAMDSWLNTLGVAVHQVKDQGLPLGTFGATQGDSRFGTFASPPFRFPTTF